MLGARTLGSVGFAVLAASGCAVAPMLADAAHDRAVVRIGYDVLGPSIEVAEASTGLVARDHCEAQGKRHELVWFRRQAQERHRGEYVFFYACERTEDRLRDRKAARPATAEDLHELARPAIETSHAEARRHRR